MIYALKCKITKIITVKRIFLLFFVSLHPKYAFVMKNLCVIAVLTLFLTACQESLEDRCERETKEYTSKHCPSKIDNTTRIDSLTFERATHTIHYYYTLTGVADNEDVLKKFDAADVLKNELKNTTTMKVYKDNGYNFAYTYHSEKNPEKVLMEVVFTDKDY